MADYFQRRWWGEFCKLTWRLEMDWIREHPSLTAFGGAGLTDPHPHSHIPNTTLHRDEDGAFHSDRFRQRCFDYL